MKVVFHAGALRDLREALDWYAKRGAVERGQRLVRMIDERIEEIARAPESFPRDPRRSWARRARVLKSPYTIVFTIHEKTVLVLAVAHGRRRSAYWARRV